MELRRRWGESCGGGGNWKGDVEEVGRELCKWGGSGKEDGGVVEEVGWGGGGGGGVTTI